jgi:hypothetical protein
MDIPFLIIAIAAAFVLPRSRAYVVTVAAWAICVAMVGWGPVHSSGVHTASLGFWVPWTVVCLIALVLVTAVAFFRSRRKSAVRS